MPPSGTALVWAIPAGKSLASAAFWCGTGEPTTRFSGWVCVLRAARAAAAGSCASETQTRNSSRLSAPQPSPAPHHPPLGALPRPRSRAHPSCSTKMSRENFSHLPDLETGSSRWQPVLPPGVEIFLQQHLSRTLCLATYKQSLLQHIEQGRKYLHGCRTAPEGPRR